MALCCAQAVFFCVGSPTATGLMRSPCDRFTKFVQKTSNVKVRNDNGRTWYASCGRTWYTSRFLPMQMAAFAAGDKTPYQDKKHEALTVLPTAKNHDSPVLTQMNATSSTIPASWSTAYLTSLPPMEQALLLLGFILCMILGAFMALIAVALPTFHAMGRLAISMESLSKIARQELPGTMAAIRLSGMEINDLTRELNHLRRRLNKTYPGGQTRSRVSESGKGKHSPIMN